MLKKLYAPRNILSTALHYSGQIAVGTGAVVMAPVLAVGAGIVITGGLLKLSLKVSKNVMETQLKRHPDIHRHSPNLGKMVEELYVSSGLDNGKYPIYDFQPKKKISSNNDKKPLSEGIREAFRTMAQTPNAAAFHLDKPIIMISEPLLKLLDDEEEKAVLAHEFAHASARHLHLGLPHNAIGSTARTAASITKTIEFFSSGFMGVTAAIGTAFGGFYLARKLHPDGELLFKKKEDLSLPEAHKKKNLSSLSATLSGLASVGVLTYFNPVFLPIWAGAKTIVVSSHLLSKSFSRSNKYQADKGAVTLGANPLSMVLALRKMDAVMKRSLESEWGNHTVPKKGTLAKYWNNLNATHPTIDRRISRLTEIAKANGFSDHHIQSAVNDPVDISHADNVPSEIIQTMAARINGATTYAHMLPA